MSRDAHDTSYLNAMAQFRSGDQIAAAPRGARRLTAIAERLTTAQRRRLPAGKFALPGRRALPIENAAHVRNAAARLAQMRKRGTVSRTEYNRAHAAIVRAEKRYGITPSRSSKSNPLPVRPYRKGKALQRDLTRYYDACTVSRSAGRFRAGKNRKDYCARVAWSRARNTGRYRDYPGFTKEESNMARRRRNARGQFVKKSGSSSRRRATAAAPRRRRRATVARRSAPRRVAARRTRTLAPRRRRRMSRMREAAAPMRMPRSGSVTWDVANEAPRRRRRARRSYRRRSYARDAMAPVIVVGAGAGEARRTRRSSRRRRTSYARERVCANRKRRSDGRFAPGRGSSGYRRSSRRRARSHATGAGSRRRYRNARGQFTRRRRSRVSGYMRNGHRVRGYLREEELDNPIGGGLAVLDNPITVGESLTVLGVAGAGWVVTDMISRYLESTPSGYSAASGQIVLPNAAAQLGMPSWTNILVQAGISIAGLGLGGYVGRGGNGGYGVAALNGLGLGAGLHLIGQLFNALMARVAGSKTSAQGTTPTGLLARLYSPEIAAQNAQYQALAQAQAASPPGSVVPGFAGLPAGLAGVPQRQMGVGALYNPGNPYGAPTVALPNGGYGVQVSPNLTAPVAAAAAAPGAVSPIPVAVPPSTSGSGSPGSSNWNGQGNGAGDCGCMGFTPYSTFPE